MSQNSTDVLCGSICLFFGMDVTLLVKFQNFQCCYWFRHFEKFSLVHFVQAFLPKR